MNNSRLHERKNQLHRQNWRGPTTPVNESPTFVFEDSTSAENDTPMILLPPKTKLQWFYFRRKQNSNICIQRSYSWWGRNRPWQHNLNTRCNWSKLSNERHENR